MIKILNKKAFTLVELIGVFAVLAIVFGLVSIAYININKSMVKTYYRGIELSMTNASGDYYSNNKNKVPMVVGEIDSVSLGELEEQEFIDPVKDVSGNRCDTTNSYVKTYRDEKENLQYLICLKCYDGYESDSCQERDINFKYVEVYGTLLNSNGSNLIETNKLYREGVYVNKSVMLHIKTQEGVKIVLTKENDNNFREEYNAVNIGSGRFGYNYATSTSGNYIIYGVYGENKKTLEQHLNVLIDKEMPTYTIVDGGENILAVDSSTNKAYLKINVVGISDSLSGIKRIRYSFEPNNNENYINVDSSETEFEIEKNLDVGNYKLKISVTDNAGNVNTREVVYRVYRFVDKPTTAICNTLTYNGNPQTLISTTNSAYSYQNNSGTNANNYNVKVVLNSGYAWSDKTVTDYQVQCSIGKASNPITVTETQSWSVNYSMSNQTKTITAASNAQGTITYSIKSQKNSSNTNVSSFSLSSTTLTMNGSTEAGTYTVVITATAAGNANYNSGSKDITVTVTVGKASNPITVTATQSWSVNYSTSNQTKTITEASSAQGTVTYSIKSQKNSSNTNVSSFSLSSTTLTMNGSTAVGTYTVVITATAAGNNNYNSGSKDITVTVTVGKASNPITVTTPQTLIFAGVQDKSFTAASGGQGNVTYSVKSQKNSSGTNVSFFTIPTASASTLRKASNTTNGSYTVVVTATAAGNNNYNSGAKDITLNVTVRNPYTLTIKYDKNTGTGTDPSNTTCSYGSNCTLATNNYTKEWYSKQSNQWKINATYSYKSSQTVAASTLATAAGVDLTTANRTITLYSNWRENTVKIQYYCNGGKIQTGEFIGNTGDVYTPCAAETPKNWSASVGNLPRNPALGGDLYMTRTGCTANGEYLIRTTSSKLFVFNQNWGESNPGKNFRDFASALQTGIVNQNKTGPLYYNLLKTQDISINIVTRYALNNKPGHYCE